jgi:hypothetical protein
MKDGSENIRMWFFPSLLRDLKHSHGPLFGNRGALLSAVLACAATESAFQCYYDCESLPELSQSHFISAAGFMSSFQRRIQEDIETAEAGSINESHLLAFCLAAIITRRNKDAQACKTFERYLRGLVASLERLWERKETDGSPGP